MWLIKSVLVMDTNRDIVVFGSQLGKRKWIPVLGVDISSTSVKLLEISKAGGQFKVESYALAPLPANAVVEKNIVELEPVVQAVAKAYRRSGSKINTAALAVAGSAVITKLIEMPSGLNDDNLEARVALEADQYIPYPLDEVAIDFDVQGESKQHPEQVEVLLAACRRESIESRVDALEMAGITAKIVEVEAYAIERSFSLIQPQLNGDKDSVIAIVDMDSTITTLSILVDGQTVYTREQLFGGRQLAEEIQRRYGLAINQANVASEQGSLSDDYKSEVLDTFQDAVIQQLTRSLQLFFASSQYQKVDQIILAGGLAATSGLIESVQNRLATATVLANPFTNMSVASTVDARSLNNNAPSLMIACGLALRSFY